MVMLQRLESPSILAHIAKSLLISRRRRLIQPIGLLAEMPTYFHAIAYLQDA